MASKRQRAGVVPQFDQSDRLWGIDAIVRVLEGLGGAPMSPRVRYWILHWLDVYISEAARAGARVARRQINQRDLPESAGPYSN
jgi:hypothetical protein